MKETQLDLHKLQVVCQRSINISRLCSFPGNLRASLEYLELLFKASQTSACIISGEFLFLPVQSLRSSGEVQDSKCSSGGFGPAVPGYLCGFLC